MSAVPAPQELELREHELTQGVELSPDDVRFLLDSPAKIRVFATGQPGRYDVRPSQIVGTLVGPRLRVVIRPKVPMRRLLFLLGYVADVPEVSESPALGEAPDLVEAMQFLFAEALEAGLKHGLVRNYRPVEEDLTAPRGRIDARALVSRRFSIFPPVPCRFDDYTGDTEANRRLLAAALKLARAATSQSRHATRLLALAGKLEGVSVTRYAPRRLPPLPRDRRLEPYRAALGLAAVVLRNSSIELRRGHAESVGFLIDMNEVYEEFVVSILRAALAAPAHLWIHHEPSLSLDVDSQVSIQPDVVWRATLNRPRLVLDVKYKSISSGAGEGVGPNADLYQMVSYCVAVGVPVGVLVYADSLDRTYTIRNTGVTVHVLGFDPDGEPADLFERARALATRLKSISEAQPHAA